MDGEAFRERIASLLRVVQATRIVKADNIPCKIEEGLYLGSLGAAHNKNALKEFSITHTLTVASMINPPFPNDFTYKTVEVLDREDVRLSQHFEECSAFIDEAKAGGGGVLVHCFAGKSRSVTIVVAYLMFKHGLSLSEAMEHVKRQRPVASPNSGFLLQLREYEASLRESKKVQVQEV